MTEMPLLVFTLIEQMTVGAFVTLAAMLLMGKAKVGKPAFMTGAVLAVLAVAGMCASLAHLGQPARALNVLQGVGSSPLSHEVLAFGLFVVCAIVFAVLAKLEKAGAAKAVAVVGAVCGLAAVIFTCLCYLLPGVPAWNSVLTPAQFILTVVACGVPLYLALAATFGGSDAEGASKKKLTWWGVFAVLLIIQIAMRWMFFGDIVLAV